MSNHKYAPDEIRISMCSAHDVKSSNGGHRGKTPKLSYNKIFCPPHVCYDPWAEFL